MKLLTIFVLLLLFAVSHAGKGKKLGFDLKKLLRKEINVKDLNWSDPVSRMAMQEALTPSKVDYKLLRSTVFSYLTYAAATLLLFQFFDMDINKLLMDFSEGSFDDCFEFFIVLGVGQLFSLTKDSMKLNPDTSIKVLKLLGFSSSPLGAGFASFIVSFAAGFTKILFYFGFLINYLVLNTPIPDGICHTIPTLLMAFSTGSWKDAVALAYISSLYFWTQNLSFPIIFYSFYKFIELYSNWSVITKDRKHWQENLPLLDRNSLRKFCGGLFGYFIIGSSIELTFNRLACAFKNLKDSKSETSKKVKMIGNKDNFNYFSASGEIPTFSQRVDCL